jgi:uroporphyrinogen-III synthase
LEACGGGRRAAAATARALITTPPAENTAPLVVLTREVGKNGKLAAALSKKGLATVELPLVESGPAADTAALPAALADSPWGWVVVTSPEAAAVFLRAWRDAGTGGRCRLSCTPGSR